MIGTSFTFISLLLHEWCVIRTLQMLYYTHQVKRGRTKGKKGEKEKEKDKGADTGRSAKSDSIKDADINDGARKGSDKVKDKESGKDKKRGREREIEKERGRRHSIDDSSHGSASDSDTLPGTVHACAQGETSIRQIKRTLQQLYRCAHDSAVPSLDLMGHGMIV